MAKFAIIAVALVLVIASCSARDLKPTGFFEDGTPGFNYDCRGKLGNYPHPSKCTHYVACNHGGIAYEMVCALNHDGKPLHYVAWSGPSEQTSRCDYPEVAGCSGGCKLV